MDNQGLVYIAVDKRGSVNPQVDNCKFLYIEEVDNCMLPCSMGVAVQRTCTFVFRNPRWWRTGIKLR